MIDIEEIYNTKVSNQLIAIGIDDAVIYTAHRFKYLYMLAEVSGFRIPKTVDRLQCIFSIDKKSIRQWKWEYDYDCELNTIFLLRYRDRLSKEEIKTFPQWFIEETIMEEVLK